jgi:hypothetical protein
MVTLIPRGTKATFISYIMRVVRGNGIKFFDEDLEVASFRTLVALYSDLVLIEDPDKIVDVIFSFQEYIHREYTRIYLILKDHPRGNHYNCDCMKNRIPMSPSQILQELDKIKRLQKLLPVEHTSVTCFCFKKLK